MPRYAYKCELCGTEITVFHSMNAKDDEKPQTCECGGKLKRIISPVSFQTHGNGFEKKGRT